MDSDGIFSQIFFLKLQHNLMNHHHQTMCEWHQAIWRRELLFSSVHSVWQHTNQLLCAQYSL